MKITQEILDYTARHDEVTLDNLIKQNLIMRKALEQYAHYVLYGDCGQIARDALKELEGGNNNLRNRSAHVLGSWQY